MCLYASSKGNPVVTCTNTFITGKSNKSDTALVMIVVTKLPNMSKWTFNDLDPKASSFDLCSIANDKDSIFVLNKAANVLYHVSKSGKSVRKVSVVATHASHEEMRETRDLNVSAKPQQSTRDSRDLIISKNSILVKTVPGTKNGKSTAFLMEIRTSFDRKREIHPKEQLSKNRSVMPFNVQYIQDSLPDPIHFIEKGFQVKNDNSTQRNREGTAFSIIQKIHNQLQNI